MSFLSPTRFRKKSLNNLKNFFLVSLVGSIIALNFVMQRQTLWLEAIERRISATTSMISSMKGIKMCGLKQTLLRNLQNLRVEELNISKAFRRLLIWNMAFGEFQSVS